MTLLRPRSWTFAALIVTALACTCQPPGGGGGGGGAAEEEPRAAKPKGKAKGGGGGGGGGAPDDGEVEMPAGVEYLGNNEWRVQRKVADRYVENPDKLGCSAREKGKGYELVGVQAADDAYALGARNHDVLLQVNGQSLDDTSDLMNLYLTLQDAKKLTVILERAGERRTHHYDIVD
jgi:hypothetical protein